MSSLRRWLSFRRVLADARVMALFSVVAIAGASLALQMHFEAYVLLGVGVVVLLFVLRELALERLTPDFYGVGDWIQIGEHEGRVEEIAAGRTVLCTRAGDLVSISHRDVNQSAIVSRSCAVPVHTEFLSVRVPSSVAPNAVRALLLEAAAGLPGVRREPAPLCQVIGRLDDPIEYEVAFAVDDLERIPEIRSELAMRIWYRLHRAGLLPAADEQIDSAPAAALEMVPLFAEMPDELRTEMALASKRALWGAGECVVEEGAAGDSCFVVRSGELGVYVTGAGREKQIARLGRGDLFGEMSLLTGEPRAATVRALTDSELLHLRPDALKRALRQSTALVDRFAEMVAIRSEEIMEAREALNEEPVEQIRKTASSLSARIRTFHQIPEHPTEVAE